MKVRRLTVAAMLALAGGLAGARAPASSTQPAAAPAPAPALVDVSGCQACHGPAGISSNPRTPNIAGQQPVYLLAQLQAFKSGARTHPLMQAVASQLGEEEMSALARYWSSQPAAGGGDPHAAAAGPAIPSRMAFPADFTLYETAATEGNVAERYANGVAVRALRAGRPLPDGSVVLVVNRPAAGVAPTGFAGMESRAGWGEAIPRVIRNGNWDYAAFDGSRQRNARLNQAPCLACHLPQAENSFVFTMPQLRTAVLGGGAAAPPAH